MSETNDKLQVNIIERLDLKMRRGKVGAQIGHVFTEHLMGDYLKAAIQQTKPGKSVKVTVYLPGLYLDWYRAGQTKVHLGCKDEAEMLALEAEAKRRGMHTVVITDNGVTEFHGVLTKTVMIIGPALKSTMHEFMGPESGLKLM